MLKMIEKKKKKIKKKNGAKKIYIYCILHSLDRQKYWKLWIDFLEEEKNVKNGNYAKCFFFENETELRGRKNPEN